MTTTRTRLTSPMLVIFVNLLLFNWYIDHCQSTKVPLDFVYHTHDEVNAFLRKAHELYPHITNILNIGQSVMKKDLLVLIISKSPVERKPGVPSTHLVGTIHGNEPLGGEMMLHLIKRILENHATDTEIEFLVDNTNLHVLPIMNPDGYAIANEGDTDGSIGRDNANGVDLNRDFSQYTRIAGKQPETLAVLSWMKKVPFLLSATFHGGATLVAYPYGNVPAYSQHSYTPDNDVFEHLARTYASDHPFMSIGTVDTYRWFPEGIVNSYKWYESLGEKQDCAYDDFQSFELTIEMSHTKYPLARLLPLYWEHNQKSMIQLLRQVHRGVRGFVKDFNTEEPIPGAKLSYKRKANDTDNKVLGDGINIKATDKGEFWRILLPGKFVMHVSAKGYEGKLINFEVTDINVTELDIKLQKKPPKLKG